jgi:hypothetical protein
MRVTIRVAIRVTFRITLFLVAWAAMLGCTHHVEGVQDERVSAPVPARGKRTAPVAIDAKLSAARARVTLRFEAAASDVTIGLQGLDGLTLGPGEAPAARAFNAGESVTVEVPFTSARGTLAVSVAGTFAGARQYRAVSFAVGAEAAPSVAAPVGAAPVTTDREQLQVLPTGR